MGYFLLGIDIGGTAVKIGLFDKDLKVLDKWSIPTRTENDGKYILPDTAASVMERISVHGIRISDIRGAGVGLPGVVDTDGLAHGSVNLGWARPHNVEQELSELLCGLKIKAGNDANVAALGEATMGAGKGTCDMVMVTLGTGIGGGVVHAGRIIAGAHGAGGEIGHICVKPDETEACNCGRHGCLEQYASATGIRRLIRGELETSDENSILRLDDEISVKRMWQAVKDGDLLAIRVAESFGDHLGFALSCIAGVLDPDIFVIGGGVSKTGDVILPFIQKSYDKYVLSLSRGTPIVRAALGNDAGIIGAACLFLA